MAERLNTTKDEGKRLQRWLGGAYPHAAGGEGGFAMVFVIFAIMVIGILGALVLLYTSYVLRNATGVTPAARAQTVAEAGLDTAHAQLASELINGNKTITGSMWEGKGTYRVDVVKNPDFGDGDPYDWLITSQGQYTAEVEGVPRTFYRTLQEVITFAGGRYYNALNYVLFSKEGDVDINFDGDASMINTERCTIEGDIYAGRDVYISNSTSLLLTDGSLDIKGDIVTERGDVVCSKRAIWANSSRTNINGNIYSGILAQPGGNGGGVLFENAIMARSSGYIDMVGDINAHGTLSSRTNRNYPIVGSITNAGYGVRIYNLMLFTAIFSGDTYTIRDNISGDVRSRGDVSGENVLGAAVRPAQLFIDIDGTVSSGEDVEFESSLIIGNSKMRNSVSGSILAAGNVNLRGEGFAGGSVYNTVGGDIQAGGDVSLYQSAFALPQSPSGFVVTHNVYGRNVNMTSNVTIAGTLANSVGENVYCRGNLNIDNDAPILGANSSVTINGSVYSSGNQRMDTSAVFLSEGRIRVNGSTGLPGYGNGTLARGDMVLNAPPALGVNRIDIAGQARDGTGNGNPTKNGNVYISGAQTPAVTELTVPQAGEPEPPDPYNEVLLPQCDFDFYREKALGQKAEDGDPRHYLSPPPGQEATVNIDNINSSLYVVFCDGDLYIERVLIPINSAAVFVATGNVRFKEVLRVGGGDAEFQIIAGNKVFYDTQVNLTLDDSDRFFIYAAHKDYDPVTDPVSVVYEMGWFRNMYGQITARGDIELRCYNKYFAMGVKNHRVVYKSPSVLSEGFRIPFTVKSWKEL